MFDAIKQFLDELSAGSSNADSYHQTDPRLAAVVLLVHAVRIDGLILPAEQEMLDRLILERFGLNEDEREKLVGEAERRDLEAVDLYGFTSVLKRTLDEEGRNRLVKMLWQIVYADRHLHEFEDNLVWRVAELLGVSSRDRIRLRKEIEDEAGL